MNMNILAWLDGYKTYIAAAVGILAIAVNHFVPVAGMTPDPDWLGHIYALIIVITGRSAIKTSIELPLKMIKYHLSGERD
jgi:hypothetical protein